MDNRAIFQRADAFTACDTQVIFQLNNKTKAFLNPAY